MDIMAGPICKGIEFRFNVRSRVSTRIGSTRWCNGLRRMAMHSISRPIWTLSLGRSYCGTISWC